MSSGSKKSNTGILADTRISETGGTPLANNDWRPLPADLHEWAVYQDELGQTRRIFEDIAKNEPLPGKALRQLDHAFDLSIYNKQLPKTPRQQKMLNAKRTALFDALAHADFNRHLESTGQLNDTPEFDYNGNTFPKSIGPKLFGAEQESWIDNNRPMHDGERAQAAKKLQADFMKATPLDEPAPKTPPVEIAQNDPDSYAQYGKAAGAIQKLKNIPKAEKIVDGWTHKEEKAPRARLLYVDASGSFKNPNRAAGHVVLEIDGKVYNKVPNGMHIIDSEKYIQNVTHREKDKGAQNIYAYPIHLNDQEIGVVKRELSKDTAKYEPFSNDCATCTIEALRKATQNSKQKIEKDPGYDLSRFFKAESPSDVIDNVKKSGRVYGPVYKYSVPEDRKNTDTGFWGIK